MLQNYTCVACGVESPPVEASSAAQKLGWKFTIDLSAPQGHLRPAVPLCPECKNWTITETPKGFLPTYKGVPLPENFMKKTADEAGVFILCQIETVADRKRREAETIKLYRDFDFC